MNDWQIYEVRQTIKISQNVQNVKRDLDTQFSSWNMYLKWHDQKNIVLL